MACEIFVSSSSSEYARGGASSAGGGALIVVDRGEKCRYALLGMTEGEESKALEMYITSSP